MRVVVALGALALATVGAACGAGGESARTDNGSVASSETLPEPANRIGDAEWTSQAQRLCSDAQLEIPPREEGGGASLDERSSLVLDSTDRLSEMLDELSVNEPSDEKGQRTVPLWIEDYRTLLEDRYAYAEELSSGSDGPFRETAVEGVPITERIAAFAIDNEMRSCIPPS